MPSIPARDSAPLPKASKAHLATLLGVLGLAVGALALAPAGAAAMTSTGTGPCLPVPGTNGEYRTHQGAPCEVLPSLGGGANLVVPSASYTFTGSAPIQPQGCRGYGCGIPHEISGGNRPRPETSKGGAGGIRKPAQAAKKPQPAKKTRKKTAPKKPKIKKDWAWNLKCAGIASEINGAITAMNGANRAIRALNKQRADIEAGTDQGDIAKLADEIAELQKALAGHQKAHADQQKAWSDQECVEDAPDPAQRGS